MDTVLYFQSAGKANNDLRLAGVQDFAAKASWHVQVVEGLPDRRAFAELKEFWEPVGVIIECGGSNAELDESTFASVPTVFLDRNPKTLSADSFSVSHDSVETARLAAKELLTTGYRNFAFVPWPEPRFWSDDRMIGFRKALAINGHGFAEFQTAAKDPGSLEYQRDLRAWVSELPRPCALFAANDRLGAEVITAANFSGIGIPNELAVVSVDNRESICESTVPPLTSVVADFHNGGYLAAELLARRIANPGTKPEHLTFGPLAVIRRASSRTMRRRDRETEAALEYIRANACSGIGSKDVLARYSCSRRMAELRFREATGRSMMEEIHSVRMNRAMLALRTNPRQDLKALADICGFSNPNSLRKLFRKKTGMSMSAWRNDRPRAGATGKGGPRDD
ncbi:MAG: substrate-binding domain-containing protein [Kiritimatiellae bacterium]|nr:substrate-binding domain-containing protein [Kiritimatiellia bacterium]